MPTLLGSYWCGTCTKQFNPKDGVIVGEVRTMVHIKCGLSGKEKEIDRGYVEDMILVYNFGEPNE